MPLMKKLGLDGEEIEYSPTEEKEVVDALKGVFNGQKRIEFTLGALEDLAKMGITKDELLAALAKDLGVQN